MDELFCQSCGMPLENEEVMGTSKDGSKTGEYCLYCYKDGEFTADITMEKMIDVSLKHMNEMFKDDPAYNEQKSLSNMQEFFPKLKRWSTAN